MEKRKNVRIIDYDYFGRGISKQDGKICFVPKVRKGYEGSCLVVKETKTYMEALQDESSQERVDCPYFYRCGGCHLRHLNEEEQLDFKVSKVKSLLAQNASLSISSISIHKTSLNHYRNKASFHIEKGEIGYFEEKTHVLLPIKECLLLEPPLQKVLEELHEKIKGKDYKMEVVVRHLGGRVLVDLKNEKNEALPFSLDSADTLYYQGKKVYGLPYLEVVFEKMTFRIAKDAFFQVNLEGMKILYQKIVENLKANNAIKVLDLYCGVGSISLFIAPYVQQVYGVEVLPEAILNARKNAFLNTIRNVQFACGKVEDLLSSLPKDYETVIVDPPRRGLDKKTKQYLLEHDFSTLLYISCDPATLTRDIKDLNPKYQLEKIELVDMFPNTYHVESLCVLKLHKNKG